MKIRNRTLWISVSCSMLLCSQALFAQITVDIIGLNDQDKAAIEGGLTIVHSKDEPNLTRAQVLNLYHVSRQELATALSSYGYYNGSVSGRLTPKPQGWLAHYQIKPGRKTTIEQVTIHVRGSGADNDLFKRIRAKHPIEIDKVLLHAEYEDLKKDLLNAALEAGYLKAAYEHSQIQVDRNRARARIILVLDTGPQYYMGHAIFEGTQYPKAYLERYLTFRPGDAYTNQRLLDLQQDLSESTLFSKVRITPDVKHQQNLHVPILIRLSAKPKNKYSAGVGYGTDTSFRTHLGWERRRLSHPGHIINLDLGISGIQDKAQLQYRIPGHNLLKTFYKLSVSFTRDVTDRINPKWYQRANSHHPLGYYNAGWDVGAAYVKERQRWKFDYGLNYVADTFREYAGEPNQHSSFLLPNASATWTYSIKDPSFIQKGLRASVVVRGARKKFGSSTDLLQGQLSLKGVHVLGEDYRLLARVDLGATRALNFDQVSPRLRFLSGGDNSVRGYSAQSLGPHELDRYGKQVVVGGRYLWVNSLEVERKITQQIRGAVFIDGGNAMNRWRTPLKYGAGFGVRVGTPLGPFRLDIARPLGREVKGWALKPNITFGWDL